MKYLTIKHNDTLHGNGNRVTLYVSGCPHLCKNCPNPASRDVTNGTDFGDNALYEIMEELNHHYVAGLTLTGGDPLHPINRLSIFSLCKTIKRLYPDKTIWLYTGYSFEEIKNFILMQYIDVLVDGKHDGKRRRILVQASLKEGRVVLRDERIQIS